MNTINEAGAALPRWVRELKHMLPVRSQFVLSGNIRDNFLIPVGGQSTPAVISLVDSLWATLSVLGYECLVVYDRVDGLRVVSNDTDLQKRRQSVERLLSIKFENGKYAQPYRGLPERIRMVTEAKCTLDTAAPRIAFVVDYASRLSSQGNELSEEEHEFFMACEKFSETAAQIPSVQHKNLPFFNPLIWLVNKLEDMPAWYLAGNERVHTVIVEHPDFDTRKVAAKTLLHRLADQATDLNAAKIAADLFANLTDGMSLRSMMAIERLARVQGITLDELGDAVRLYKVGLPGNPWKSDGVRQKISQATEVLCKRVKGQPQAVQKTVDILIRSVEGLTGAHSASATSGRPRGVLFFAGPTGVGKTELAKALTELIFGDDHSYIRFDMSEFSTEHADQRLIGAPPGYLGHSAGGELTNAIRERPFSVVLFDEIEKANPAILDKFLQILEDGRLTDGRGETVYFSEAVLVFTSNLGVFTKDSTGASVQQVKAGDDYETVSKTIRLGIENHFKFQLNRPELLNRFGDNIVVFGYISPEVAEQILSGMLINVCKRVESVKGTRLILSEAAKAVLKRHCLADLNNGGRGIANKLESGFVNPLARALFAQANHAQVLVVNAITYDTVTSSFTVELL